MTKKKKKTRKQYLFEEAGLEHCLVLGQHRGIEDVKEVAADQGGDGREEKGG